MGCLFVLASFIAPRLVLFFVWLLSDWLSRSYETIIWPLLGFFFLPYTTLAYMAAMLKNDGNVSGAWIGLIIVAVVLDMGTNSQGKRAKKS